MALAVVKGLLALAALCRAAQGTSTPAPHLIITAAAGLPTRSFWTSNPIRTVVTINSNQIDVLAGDEKDVRKVEERLRQLCAGPYADIYPEICEGFEFESGPGDDSWWPSEDTWGTIATTTAAVSADFMQPTPSFPLSLLSPQTLIPVPSTTNKAVSLTTSSLAPDAVIAAVPTTINKEASLTSSIPVSDTAKWPKETTLVISKQPTKSMLSEDTRTPSVRPTQVSADPTLTVTTRVIIPVSSEVTFRTPGEKTRTVSSGEARILPSEKTRPLPGEETHKLSIEATSAVSKEETHATEREEAQVISTEVAVRTSKEATATITLTQTYVELVTTITDLKIWIAANPTPRVTPKEPQLLTTSPHYTRNAKEAFGFP